MLTSELRQKGLSQTQAGQDPKPFREGNWWWITPRKDEFVDGKLHRVRTRMKVCSSDIAEREARKMAAELLRPMNQGLETIGSTTRFADYVNSTYKLTWKRRPPRRKRATTAHLASI